MKNKLLYFFLLVMLPMLSKAQGKKICPGFYLDKPIGCVPLHVKAIDTSGSINANIKYKFHTNLTFGDSTTHTYSTTGTFYVTQKGSFNCDGGVTGLDSSAPHPVVVKPIPAPTLQMRPCSDKNVLIIASGPQYDIYNVSQNNGTPVTILKNKTAVWQLVTNSAVLDVQGLYADANCGANGTLQVSAFDNLVMPIVQELVVLNSTQATISFQTVSGQLYEISKRTGNSGSFVPVDTLDNVQGLQTYTISGLNTDLSSYCFKIRSFDYCGLNAVTSPEYCTISVAGTIQNEANSLIWNTDANLTLSNYGLKINTQSSSVFPSRTNATAFTDVDVVCGQQYCYQIEGTYSNGVVTKSNQKCLKAISNAIPPAVGEILSTVDLDVVQLNWSAASAQSYTVDYSVDKSSFSNLTTTGSNSVTDLQHNPSNASLCYRVSYVNDCGNTSPVSPETCPVFLQGKVFDAASRQVSWKPFVGWAEGVQEYIVEKLDDSGKPYSSISVGNVQEYLDKGLDTLEQIITYRIKAISKTGRVSYSNNWLAEQKGAFYMPNAFSPNGDGLNDVFHAEGLFIKEFKMEIWNRNGEGVFAGTSFRQGWDGKINGQAAPVDTYMYKVEAADKLGVTYKRTGTLQLLK